MYKDIVVIVLGSYIVAKSDDHRMYILPTAIYAFPIHGFLREGMEDMYCVKVFTLSAQHRSALGRIHLVLSFSTELITHPCTELTVRFLLFLFLSAFACWFLVQNVDA